MAIRRVKASFPCIHKLTSSLMGSDLFEDLKGCAIDPELKMAYFHLSTRKTLITWNKYEFLERIEPWKSKEDVQSFAERHCYLYLSGKSKKSRRKVGKIKEKGSLNHKRLVVQRDEDDEDQSGSKILQPKINQKQEEGSFKGILVQILQKLNLYK